MNDADRVWPHPALCRMSRGLKTKNEQKDSTAPFGFMPMEPRFGNWLRQFSNPCSPGVKPGGDDVWCGVSV
jgi:hypothetical protein